MDRMTKQGREEKEVGRNNGIEEEGKEGRKEAKRYVING